MTFQEIVEKVADSFALKLADAVGDAHTTLKSEALRTRRDYGEDEDEKGSRVPKAARVAERYVQASVLTKTYYHATYLEDAKRIARTGFRINRAGRGKVLGPAVYVTADRAFSQGYADDIVNDEMRDVGMLHLRLNVRQFWDVRTKNWTTEMWRMFLDAGGSRGDTQNYPLIGEVARRNGFEAAGVPEGNVAVFDPKKVRVLKVEPILVSRG